MKKFAVFGLLTILLISFGSCRNEEILEDKENSKQQLELINSKSLWKENITFISKAKKSFEKRVNKKYFINAHGFPLWEYSLSFEKDNEPYIFVPIFKKGEITEVLLIVKKEEKIFLYYVKEKSKIEFFNILIYGNAHASNRNTSHLRVYCGWRTFEWIWENNDGSTDTNYTTEYFCLDINEASIDYNTDGGGGIMLGDYIGGSDWGAPIDLPLLNDPCKKAKAGVNKANTTLADARIKTDFKDNLADIAKKSTNSETSITIGIDSNGNLKLSDPITVIGTAGKVPAAPAGYSALADGHNHNSSNPPSPGDLWTMMENLVNNPHFETRYVFGQDGSIYALTVNNRQAAIDFLAANPRSQYLKPNSGDFIQENNIIPVVHLGINKEKDCPFD